MSGQNPYIHYTLHFKNPHSVPTCSRATVCFMRRGAASALLRVPTFRYSALVDSLFCACVAARSSALCYGWMYSVVCCVTTQHSVVCCVTAPAGALCRGALHRLGEAVDSCRFLPRRPCPPSGCPAAAGLRPLQARSSGPAQPEPGEPRRPRAVDPRRLQARPRRRPLRRLRRLCRQR